MRLTFIFFLVSTFILCTGVTHGFTSKNRTDWPLTLTLNPAHRSYSSDSNANCTAMSNGTPTATLSSSSLVCAGSSSALNFAGTPGSTLNYTLNGVSGFFAISSSGTAFITPTSLGLGTTWPTNTNLIFTGVSVESGATLCTTPLAIEITVRPQPTVSEFTVPSTVCLGATATVNIQATPNTVVTFSFNGIATQVNVGALGQASWISPALTFNATINFINIDYVTAPLCSSLAFISNNTINVITPVFEPLGPFCYSAEAQSLPTTSTNGISGSWNRTDINTMLVGVTNYIFTPTGPNCNGYNVSLPVTILELPLVSMQSAHPTCSYNCDGRITAEVIGGDAPYSYSWSNGATTSTADNLCAGSYSLVVTDANGCVSQNEDASDGCFQITSIWVDACGLGAQEGLNEMFFMKIGDTPLNLDSSTVAWPLTTFTNFNCSNTSFIAAANAANAAGGVILATPSNRELPANADVVIMTSNTPTIDANVFAGIADTLYMIFHCASIGTGYFGNGLGAGGTRTLYMQFGASCSGAVTYNTSSLSTTDGASVIFSPNGSAIYIDNDCEAPFFSPENEVVLTVQQAIVPTFNYWGSFGPYCYGSSANPLPEISDNGISGYWNPSFINTLIEGTRTYQFTPLSDACASATSIDVTVVPSPVVNFTSTNNACLGLCTGSITASPIGGISPYSYSWSNGATTQTITNLCDGSYGVSITDGNFCTSEFSTASISTSITQLNASVIGDSPICYGETATFQLVGTPNCLVQFALNGIPATVSLDASGAGQIIIYNATYSQTVQLISMTDGICSLALNNSASIAVYPNLTATISTISPICAGTNAITDFTGPPNGVVTFTHNGNLLTITLNGAGSAQYTIVEVNQTNQLELVSVTNGLCTNSVTGSVSIDVLFDASCGFQEGCIDPLACNYEATAVINNGTCTYPGCTDPLAGNYDAVAGCDDGSCVFAQGCTDALACNYDALAVVNDGTCTYPGCTNPSALNYNPQAGCDDGSCIYPSGCTDVTACNYDAAAITDDGSCTYPGCTDPSALNYNSSAGCEDFSCYYPGIPGCLDPMACNFNSQATYDDFTCLYPGCLDGGACNYNPSAGCDDGSCIYPGCTDFGACNYDANAGCSNGSCQYPGCLDPIAINYNPSAGCDDGSCTYSGITGCTDPTACNYNSQANYEDFSCVYPGCMDGSACNYNPIAGCDDGSCTYPGCLDPLALNYNPQAGCDDGSCAFNDSFVITPSDSNPCVCSGGVQFSPSSGLLYSISLFNANNQLIYSQSNLSGASSIDSLCPTVYHAVVTYTTGAIVDDYFEVPAGAISTGDAHKVIVCQEAYPFGFGYDLTPELTTFVEGGTWYAPNNSIIATSDLSNLNVQSLASGWYTYVTYVNNCPVTTGIYLQTNNLGLTTTYIICDSYEPFSMLEMLEGQPDTIGYWIDSQLNIISNGLYSPATMDEGMFTYVIDNLEGCAPAIRTLMIIERQQNSAGQSTAFSTCEEGTTIDLFELIAGNPDTGGFWSLPGRSTSSEQTIILEASPSVSGIYSYIVASQVPCLTQVSEISIVVGVEGCTDPTAYNYDAHAACDDSSCVYTPGCTDVLACNFDATADINDGSCTYPGCTDANACNYDDDAACDDGSCQFIEGDISGPQLVFVTDEDTYTFPCDAACEYLWTVSDLIGTDTLAGFAMEPNNVCEVTVAWGEYTGIAKLQLQVSCDNGCTAEFEYPVQIDTGIEEAMIGQLSVYPNPTTDGFTVQLSSAFLGGTLTVHNALGQVIYTGTGNQPQQIIDSTTWEAGVYMVHIQQDDHTAHAILVKQ